VANAGGRIIVMPHADVDVIAHAHAKGMRCTPGVATPTEAFAALRAGADNFVSKLSYIQEVMPILEGLKGDAP